MPKHVAAGKQPSVSWALEVSIKSLHTWERRVGGDLLFYSILFYSRLCPSTAGSSPPPESSIFLCPLLSSFILLLVAPHTMSSLQRRFGLLADLPPSVCHSVLLIVHLLSFIRAMMSSPFPFRIGYVLDYVCHPGSLPNGDVTNFVF